MLNAIKPVLTFFRMLCQVVRAKMKVRFGFGWSRAGFFDFEKLLRILYHRFRFSQITKRKRDIEIRRAGIEKYSVNKFTKTFTMSFLPRLTH